MGPQAGFDLASKITAATSAKTDQDHHSVIVFSFPADMPDRTAFLLGRTGINPADALAKQLSTLADMNVDVAAIACNTAHAPPIFKQLKSAIENNGMRLQLLNLIEETVDYIRRIHPSIKRVGILGTRGTYQFRLYDIALERAGLNVILPDETVRNESVFRAVYDTGFGIKKYSNPVTEKAREHVEKAIVHLIEKKAEVVILGCTELPLAFALVPSKQQTLLIDPAVAMAQALIRFAETR